MSSTNALAKARRGRSIESAKCMQTGHGVTKSMDISVQYLSGIGTGFKRPCFQLLELSALLQEKQLFTCGIYQVDFCHDVHDSRTSAV